MVGMDHGRKHWEAIRRVQRSVVVVAVRAGQLLTKRASFTDNMLLPRCLTRTPTIQFIHILFCPFLSLLVPSSSALLASTPSNILSYPLKSVPSPLLSADAKTKPFLPLRQCIRFSVSTLTTTQLLSPGCSDSASWVAGRTYDP